MYGQSLDCQTGKLEGYCYAARDGVDSEKLWRLLYFLVKKLGVTFEPVAEEIVAGIVTCIKVQMTRCVVFERTNFTETY